MRQASEDSFSHDNNFLEILSNSVGFLKITEKVDSKLIALCRAA